MQTEVPACVQKALADQLYRRGDDPLVRSTLNGLGIPTDSILASFYLRFIGPFGSQKFSHELLDLVDQDENIVASTQICREQYGFPDSSVVLTTMSANSVYVYSCEDNCVYDIDFEGGDEEFLSGTLEPKWQSFQRFLQEFFC